MTGKKLIAACGDALGPQALKVLQMMRDLNEELAYECGRGYVGDQRVCGGRTFYALCRACAISDTLHRHTIYHRINETGLKLLKDRGL